MIGISNFYAVLANAPFTTNVVPASVGLTSPIAANQKQKFRAWVPFSVGATGGIRQVISVPAGATMQATVRLNNNVAPSTTTAVRTDGTAFTNAVANAGTSWLEVEGEVTNGATAGSIDLLYAQNTSDALTLNILAGASMEVIKY